MFFGQRAPLTRTETRRSLSQTPLADALARFPLRHPRPTAGTDTPAAIAHERREASSIEHLIVAAAEADFKEAEARRLERLAVVRLEVARVTSDREMAENSARYAHALLTAAKAAGKHEPLLHHPQPELSVRTPSPGTRVRWSAASPAANIASSAPAVSTALPPAALVGKALATSLAWARLGLGSPLIGDGGMDDPKGPASQVVVTLWRDPSICRQVVWATAGGVNSFARAARMAFLEAARKEISFYFLEAGGMWDHRLRVDSNDTLSHVVATMHAASPWLRDQPTLFLYDDSISPDASPGPEGAALPAPAAAAPALAPSRSGSGSESASVRSGRPASVQRNFRARVLQRDGARCVFCGGEDGGVAAAHLVEDNKHAEASLLESLGLVDTFDTTNGITLCSECHDAFDAHLVYVDSSTGCLKVARALEFARGFQDKWAPLQGRRVRIPPPLYAQSWPMPALFDYGRALFEADGAARRANVMRCAQICPLCHLRRFATTQGLARHMHRATCREIQAAPVRAASRLRLLRTPGSGDCASLE